MKKYRLFGILVVFLLSVGLLISGCGNSAKSTSSNAPEKKTIKIGACANSIEMANSGQKALEDMGYNVEFITYDDFFLPNTALVEGSINANFYQHQGFMDSYNKSKNTKIVMLEPKMYNYFTGFYSKKAKSINELPEGGKIGLDNDATNLSQNLQLLDKWGIIKLTKEKKDLYSIVDIVDNPKKFKFIQLDPNPKIAAYNDGDLAGMVNASCTVFMGGLDPNKDILFKDVDDNYALGICLMSNDVNSQLAKDLVKAYTSDDAVAKVQESYQGAFIRVE